MLSPRAKAFTVQSLLSQDEGQKKPTFAQLVHELPFDGASRTADLSRKSDRELEPISGMRPRSRERLWCCNYDMDYTASQRCPHPSVVTASDEHHVHGVSVELCQADLWEAFHSLGTEMIITRAGRRMFPAIRLHIRGLDPSALYRLSLEFEQCGMNKYRYVYHSSKWTVAGVGETDNISSDRTYRHPDSPVPGHTLMSQALSFERVKLTNCSKATSGQVSLSSMQKFQPKLHIEQVVEAGKDDSVPPSRLTFVFPQTSFMAVTAYQNQQITRLKIARNPFAKGFREAIKHKSSVPDIMPGVCGVPVPPCLTTARYSCSPTHDGYPSWKRARHDVTLLSSPADSNPTRTELPASFSRDSRSPAWFFPPFWNFNHHHHLHQHPLLPGFSWVPGLPPSYQLPVPLSHVPVSDGKGSPFVHVEGCSQSCHSCSKDEGVVCLRQQPEKDGRPESLTVKVKGTSKA